MKSLKHIIDAYIDDTGSKSKTNILNHQLIKPTIPSSLAQVWYQFSTFGNTKGRLTNH